MVPLTAKTKKPKPVINARPILAMIPKFGINLRFGQTVKIKPDKLNRAAIIPIIIFLANILFSYILCQLRKRNIDIYWNT